MAIPLLPSRARCARNHRTASAILATYDRRENPAKLRGRGGISPQPACYNSLQGGQTRSRATAGSSRALGASSFLLIWHPKESTSSRQGEIPDERKFGFGNGWQPCFLYQERSGWTMQPSGTTIQFPQQSNELSFGGRGAVPTSIGP